MELLAQNYDLHVEPSLRIVSTDDQQVGGLTVALIPAYNEERFIGSLVLAVRNYVDQVLVIDDGSHDHTAVIARGAGAIVVEHEQNRGKAAAVNTGFKYLRQIRPFAVVMLDGDGQHCADDIPQVLKPVIEDAADIVVGSRFQDVKSDIPAYRRIGQHSLTVATNLTSGVWMSDSQSGFRAFSSRAIEHLSFSQSGFSIESEMQFLVGDHQLRFVEVPIKVIYAEPAKRNPYKHGLQVLNGILQLVGQSRPLLFFGLSGAAIFMTGLLIGLLVIDIHRETTELAVGYALITVLVSVIGVILMFAGLILHSTRGMLLDIRNNMIERLTGVHFPGDRPDLKSPQPVRELEIEVGK